MTNVKAHDFPEVYKSLNINLSNLGCVMLDLIPLESMYSIELDGAGVALYYAKDKTRFWINGWVLDKDPHITLMYGLLSEASNYEKHIERVLSGWKMSTVKIEDIGYFDSPYEDEPYYCIIAHIEKTPELVEGNERLKFLPHVNTFPGYKPHITIAYIDKNQGEAYRDKMIQEFRSLWNGKELQVKESLNFGGNK